MAERRSCSQYCSRTGSALTRVVVVGIGFAAGLVLFLVATVHNLPEEQALRKGDVVAPHPSHFAKGKTKKYKSKCMSAAESMERIKSSNLSHMWKCGLTQGPGCDPFSSAPCCSSAGWCGNSPKHCMGSHCRDKLSENEIMEYRELIWPRKCMSAAESKERIKSMNYSRVWKCGRTQGCDPFSSAPCCSSLDWSSDGWCGISPQHCAKFDCRRKLTEAELTEYQELVWSKLCSVTVSNDSSVTYIRHVCPKCFAGDYWAAVSDDKNEQKTFDGQDRRFAQLCYHLGALGGPQMSNASAPASIFQIDVLELGSQTPSIYWPRSSDGYVQVSAAKLTKRRVVVAWRRIMSLLRPAGKSVVNAVDIGANIGDTTMNIGLSGPSGRVVAFEMLPSNFAALNFFAQLNPWLKIDAYNYAIGPRNGTISAAAQGGNGKVNSFELSESGEIVMVELHSFLNHTYGYDFIQGVDFIKIDTEGNDKHILKWIQPLLEISRPVVQIEWYEAHRKCVQGTSYSQETFMLFKVVDSIGYLPHHPSTLAHINITREPCNFKTAPLDLVLLPKELLSNVDMTKVARNLSAADAATRLLGPLPR